MKQCAESLIVAGRNVEEIVLAPSTADAIAVVKAKYGNLPEFGARIIG